MKKLLFLLLFAFASIATMNAQIVNGDLDHDGNISMTDANRLVNIFVKNDKYEYIEGVDNNAIVGTWYKSKYESITFGADGILTLENNDTYTFKFLPALNSVLLYNCKTGRAEGMLDVWLFSDDLIVLYDIIKASGNTYYSTAPAILVSSITLSQSSATITVDKPLTLTTTVLPDDADDKSVVWTSSNTSVAKVNGGIVTGLSAGSAIITATANDGSGESASCEVTVLDPYNGHAYIDLGLSVRWATCNIGASTPGAYGDYFAWGEVETKTSYTWETYKWCNGTDRTQTKYCEDKYYGTIDNKTVLEPEDDAAHVKWGGDWRMPTKAEMDELRLNCTWTWETQNGVGGYKVTGTNGNSIFLPAEGYRTDTEVRFAGENGYYWTNTLNADLSYAADEIAFYKGKVDPHYAYRYFGQAIRPVCPVKVESITISQTTATLEQGETLTLSATVYPSHATDKSVTWSSSNPNVATVNSSGEVTAIKGGFATITATANDGSGVSAMCDITVPGDPFNDHDYVDLGLSVKWATVNIGASKAEEYGDYFAWGEVEAKTSYDWDTYKWCKGTNKTLTKYCVNSDFGSVDNLSNLELKDDAASVNWGGLWRLPTKEEFDELHDKCTWTWMKYSNVYGYRITGANGNYIFLPAGGVYTDSDLQYTSTNGFYWSSSLGTGNDSSCANYMTFFSDYIYQITSDRAYGLNIRPVCKY